MNPFEIAFLPAVELVARIRARELSPIEAVDAVFAQYAALNPILNAVVTPAYEQARAAAREAEEAVRRGDELGPLHGVPIGLKDMTETAGLRTTYGSKLYEHNVPAADALLVTRLKQAGGIIVGKTNTPEFAAGINTRNPVFGQTLNPWNTDLNPGGSSGGSAVAVATGMCALAEGSDHGGSLRNPASYCNVVGFRVSAGRIPAYPSAWLYDPTNTPTGDKQGRSGGSVQRRRGSQFSRAREVSSGPYGPFRPRQKHAGVKEVGSCSLSLIRPRRSAGPGYDWSERSVKRWHS